MKTIPDIMPSTAILSSLGLQQDNFQPILKSCSKSTLCKVKFSLKQPMGQAVQ